MGTATVSTTTALGQAAAGAGDALVANPLSQFGPTTSAQLAGVLSDETGTGAAVFAGSPTLTGAPNIAAATGTSLSVSGSLTSTVATGTAPLVVSSTTNVPNLNASSLSGATFAAPGAIGGGTPAAINGTTITGTAGLFSTLFNLTGIEVGLTAHSGGTQAAALALSATKAIHLVETVGASNDSVALPAAVVGAVHVVWNSGAGSTLKLYGTTPDTIDDVATATGISIGLSQGVICICSDAGRWYTVGYNVALLGGKSFAAPAAIGATTPAAGTFTNLISNTTMAETGIEDTITAHAGGTQASGFALSATKSVHHVTVCATSADSVLLPVLVIGEVHKIFNSGAASCQVFGAGTSTINDVATATGVALAAGKGAAFHAIAAGKWYAVMGA